MANPSSMCAPTGTCCSSAGPSTNSKCSSTSAWRSVAERFRPRAEARAGEPPTRGCRSSDLHPLCRALAYAAVSSHRVMAGSVRARPAQQTTQLIATASQTPAGDLREGLGDDRSAHLRLAEFALDEDDGHLGHAEPGLDGAVGHIDLEAVPLRLHVRQIERLEHSPRVGTEAGGRVPDPQSHDRSDVDLGAAGLAEPRLGPDHDASTGHPPRSDDEIGLTRAGDIEQLAQVEGTMRTVGIELADDLVLASERPGEPGDIGHAEAGFLAPMENVDAGIGPRQLLGPLPCAVG